jgi:hypothetical protein
VEHDDTAAGAWRNTIDGVIEAGHVQAQGLIDAKRRYAEARGVGLRVEARQTAGVAQIARSPIPEPESVPTISIRNIIVIMLLQLLMLRLTAGSRRHHAHRRIAPTDQGVSIEIDGEQAARVEREDAFGRVPHLDIGP